MVLELSQINQFAVISSFGYFYTQPSNFFLFAKQNIRMNSFLLFLCKLNRNSNVIFK